MINPHLMGLNNFDNVPTPKDLWKNEKQKYRHWIILFGIGLFVVLAFYLTGAVLNIVNKDSIILALQEQYKDFPKSETLVQNAWITQHLVFPSLIISLLSIGLFLYVITITKSYLHTSFAQISLLSISVISFGALFSFIQLIMFLISLSRKPFNFNSMGSIFIFITSILFIVVYFTSATKVNRIRRQFAYSEYVQKLKTDERFINFQDHLKNSMVNQSASPFAPGIINPIVAPMPAANNQETKINDLKTNDQYEKLNAMSIEKLQEIAIKLSISGVELMQKNELISTIIRVSSSK